MFGPSGEQRVDRRLRLSLVRVDTAGRTNGRDAGAEEESWIAHTHESAIAM